MLSLVIEESKACREILALSLIKGADMMPPREPFAGVVLNWAIEPFTHA